MTKQPNKATVKDGLPTAEQIIDQYPMEKDFWSLVISRESAIQAMQEFSDQQNAELRNQIADLERENSEYRAVYDSVVKNRDELSGQLQSETESRKHWQRQAQRYQKYHKELNSALERVKELESDLDHHKRVIFSLQTDIENKKWFDVYEKDLIFLREILERFEKSDRDVTQREYVEQMLKDWIAELEAK